MDDMKNNNFNYLDAPKLPQRNKNGEIDVSNVDGDSMLVIIDKYEHEKPNDRIDVFVGDIKFKTYSLNPGVINAPIYISKKFSDIPNGDYEVTYVVTDIMDTAVRSEPTNVKIINSSSTKYLPPYYPDATKVISYSELKIHKGLRVRIDTDMLDEKDQIVFHWSGEDFFDKKITLANWQSTVITVSFEEKQQGYIEILVPLSCVLSLNEHGTGHGYYSIKDKEIESAISSIIVELNDISPPILVSSSGAPAITSDYPQIHSKNTVFVYGPPGKKLIANISQGKILESNEKEYYFQPDINGLAIFNVQSDEPGDILCNVFNDEYIYIAKNYIIFSPWNYGNDAISAYGFTEGVPADGISNCDVYIIIDRNLYTGHTMIATTDGSSKISGYYGVEAQKAHIFVSDEGFSTFHITNTIAEKNNVTLSYPGLNEPIKFTIHFISFPYGFIK